MIKHLADKIRTQINQTVVHQELLTELALTALFSGGHVLLEGVPGLAKTLWVRTLARLLDVTYKRVQFTSDLMPSDIVGTKVFNPQTGTFTLRKGPLFTQLFLADEINRTPPKTQSALLEVMEERSITIDGETYVLAEPFFVMATQNPIEYEGTYPLPEALTDRFMMKLLVTYPGVAAEKRILQMHHAGFENLRPIAINKDAVDTATVDSAAQDSITMDGAATDLKTGTAGLTPVCNAGDIATARSQVRNVRVEDSLFNYIVSIVETTRRINAVMYGASPRGSVALLLASKTYAALQGRDFVIPDDVRFLAAPVLRHRVLLKPEAEIDGVTPDQVIESILNQVKVPR